MGWWGVAEALERNDEAELREALRWETDPPRALEIAKQKLRERQNEKHSRDQPTIARRSA